MKKLTITIFLTFLISSITYASDVVEINVTGSIAATTCNVKTKSQQINLGSWQAQSTSGIGSGINSQSPTVEYSLDFDCPPGLLIKGQLEGNQYDASNMYYIGLDKGDTSADGVVIVIHFFSQSIWQSLVYGDTRTLITSTVDGTNSVKLRSFYKQIASTIKSGVANATTTITLTYE